MDKDILCTWESFIFYTDGTYRCTHWEEDDYSKWRIIDEKFLDVMHKLENKWTSDHNPVPKGFYEPNERDKQLVQQILLAKAIIDIVEN